MYAMAFQITGVSNVCSNDCSGAEQRKHPSSGDWPLWGNPPATSELPSQLLVTGKMFPSDDVIMVSILPLRCQYIWWYSVFHFNHIIVNCNDLTYHNTWQLGRPYKDMYMKKSSGKYRLFSSDLNVLNSNADVMPKLMVDKSRNVKQRFGAFTKLLLNCLVTYVSSQR